ncbi:F-box protein CPR1-like [Solanum dulcamara]|uniref:F-box protein CPR1-like n=1 Tax=Solanum dulcamara TaxID=45834 RepID=UPI0024867D4D|nr:F-box protein CPR1-like [Solanum dulcamara]
MWTELWEFTCKNKYLWNFSATCAVSTIQVCFKVLDDIDFRAFSMRHLKNSRISENLLVSQWYPHKKEFFLYCSSLSSVQRVEEVQKLDCPSVGRCALYCCYDSLALVGVSNYRNYAYERLFLWKPSTRESIALPHPKLELNWNLRIWGLGYDSTSDDYKIFKITYRSHSEILELKSGSWRLIDTDKHRTCRYPRLSNTDSLAFVHEAFHWHDFSMNNYVVSFSISNEVYRQIPLLKQIYSPECIDGVSALGEMLCVYSRYVSHTNDIFKIWIMKDYGVKESWTELFNIQGTAVPVSIQLYQSIGFRMEMWYSSAIIHVVLVLALGHPKGHMDSGLNMMNSPFTKDSFIQKVISSQN